MNTDKNINHLDEDKLARILRKMGPPVEPAPEVAAEVKSVVREAWKEKVQARKVQRRNLNWLAMAAALVLMVGVGIYQQNDMTEQVIASINNQQNRIEVYSSGHWRALSPSSGSQQISDGKNILANGLHANEKLRTGQNSLISLVLVNGVNVRVAENTELTLDSADSFSLNKGKIYIDSYGHGAGLMINTPYGSASDIGTQFLVASNNDGWSVQVREGQVAVSGNSIQSHLGAGNKIDISSTDQLFRSDVGSNDFSWRWAENVAPEYIIEGQTLAAYLDWYSRETGKQVQFVNDKIYQRSNQVVLHGSIAGLNPSESLPVVLATTDLELGSDASGVVTIQSTPDYSTTSHSTSEHSTSKQSTPGQ